MSVSVQVPIPETKQVLAPVDTNSRPFEYASKVVLVVKIAVIFMAKSFLPVALLVGSYAIRSWRYHIGGNRPLRFSSGLGTGNGRITVAWLEIQPCQFKTEGFLLPG